MMRGANKTVVRSCKEGKHHAQIHKQPWLPDPKRTVKSHFLNNFPGIFVASPENEANHETQDMVDRPDSPTIGYTGVFVPPPFTTSAIHDSSNPRQAAEAIRDSSQIILPGDFAINEQYNHRTNESITTHGDAFSGPNLFVDFSMLPVTPMNGASDPFEDLDAGYATESAYHSPSGSAVLSFGLPGPIYDYPNQYRSNWQGYNYDVNPSSSASFQFVRYFF